MSRVCTFVLGSAEHERVCGARELEATRAREERLAAEARAREEAALRDMEGDIDGDEPAAGDDETARLRWRQVRTQGADWADKLKPCPRSGHSAVYFPAERGVMGSTDKLVLFGGHVFEKREKPKPFRAFQDVVSGMSVPHYVPGLHVLDLQTSTWFAPEVGGQRAPCPRHSHSAVLLGTRMVIFGGRAAGGVLLQDAWFLDLADFSCLEWIEVDTAGTVPPRRCLHAAVALGTSALLVHGGLGDDGTARGDLWRLDLDAALAALSERNPTLRRLAQQAAWAEPLAVGQNPPSLAGHGAAVLPGGGRLLVVGESSAAVGRGGRVASAALWELDLVTMIWTDTCAPPVTGEPPLWGPRCSLSVSGRLCLVFGAAGALRVLDLSTNAWVQPAVRNARGHGSEEEAAEPKHRLGHSATTVGSRVVCFGGCFEASSAPTDEVLVFDLEMAPS
eukprot:g7515.t1